MATDRDDAVVRNNRRTRILHTSSYLVIAVLLVTGWWLSTGHEGHPSVLARLVDEPDVELHRKAGWGLVALGIVAVTFGIRGTITFVRETFRINRGDGRWFMRWPLGALRGRFATHRGHFDPGQRVANVLFVATLGTLIVTGIGLTTLHGGPTFVWLARAHRSATYVLTVLVIAHVILAVGILPGYRGAWRAMHRGGCTPAATMQRLWPSEAQGSARPPARARSRGPGRR
jgi:formate dehydrogenase subunit gamma